MPGAAARTRRAAGQGGPLAGSGQGWAAGGSPRRPVSGTHAALPGVQGAALPNKLVYCTASHLPTPKPVTKQQPRASFFGEKTRALTLTHTHRTWQAGAEGEERRGRAAGRKTGDR